LDRSSSRASIAALALLLRPRRYTALIAAMVAGAGVTALVIYRYYDIKAFGPIPQCTNRSGSPRRRPLSSPNRRRPRRGRGHRQQDDPT